MKILHIIDSGGLYGAEVMLLNLVAEQVKLGLEPVIASIGNKGIDTKPIEAEAERRGFAVQEFRMHPGPNLLGAFKVLRFAWRGKFDLMHSHGYKGNILFGFMPRALRKVPMISTLHGWTSTNGYSKMRAYEWIDSHSLKYIDAVILVSKGMLSHPRINKMRGTNFLVVNNGITFSPVSTAFPVADLTNQPFSSLEKQVVDFCKGGVILGSIGRLSLEKDHQTLIDVIRILRSRFYGVRMVIIGEGDCRKTLERKIKELHLNEHVFLPGYIPDASRLIRYFNIFLISSITEGLPITLLESMQSEVPIVATAVGGIPESLDYGKAGLLVNPGNPVEMADAVEKLLSNRALFSKIVDKAKHRVQSCYSRKAMAESYLKEYLKLSRVS